MLASGTPQIVPLFVPKERPVGRLPFMAHDVILPGPVSAGINGRSLLTSSRTMVKFSGVYVRLVGSWSFTVMLR